jgi:hypothetical protein
MFRRCCGILAIGLALWVGSSLDIAHAATDAEAKLLAIIEKLEARVARLKQQATVDRQKRNAAPAGEPAADRPAQLDRALAAAAASQAQSRSQTENVALPAVQQTPRWDGLVFGASIGFAQLKSRFRSEGTTGIAAALLCAS